MLNTLANHGFLPHNGKNITEEITVNALHDALNINKTLGKFLFDFAVGTNPVKNSTFYDLDHLSRHNVLEHDASLRLVKSSVEHSTSPKALPPTHLPPRLNIKANCFLQPW